MSGPKKQAGNKLIKAGGAALKVAEFASVLGEIGGGLQSILGYMHEADLERTKRAQIEHETRVQVERVGAFREVMCDYLERSFDERRENFAAFFARLDAAQARGDMESAAAILGAMVDLAKSSPFDALRDVGAMKSALKAGKLDVEF